MKEQNNDNDFGLIKLIGLIVIFYLVPAVYYLFLGGSESPTKILIASGITLEYTAPWYFNLISISFLLISMLITYILSTDLKTVITAFTLSFSLSFGFILFKHIFSSIEFYSILLLIIATGMIFTPLIIVVELLNKQINEEIIISSLIGLIYGVGIGTLIVFDPTTAFAVSVVSFIFFATLYKIREAFIKKIKPALQKKN